MKVQKSFLQSLVLTCAVLLGLCPTISQAGSRLVSANPYDMTAIKTYTTINANAYHVPKNNPPNLSEAAYGKPVIYSTDGTFDNPSAAESWIQTWADDIANAGRHLEHYDLPIHYIAGDREDHHKLENWNTWPSSAKNAMNYMAPYNSTLSVGGTLGVANGTFTWNGSPVTLMGISMVGAMIMGDLDYEAYLDVLAQGGVNLTRLWIVEQWTSLGATDNYPSGYEIGIYPFTGNYINKNFNLQSLNNSFFTHMKDFVQEAADRGIVCQITLTDRCGLEATYGTGGWSGSPYNAANNVHSFLTDPAGYALPWLIGRDNKTPADAIAASHRLLFERVADELKDEGNVIIEIMNEPLYQNGRWPKAEVVSFHQWAADVVDAKWNATPAIPNDILDTFAGTSGQTIVGTTTDSGTGLQVATWTGSSTNGGIKYGSTDNITSNGTNHAYVPVQAGEYPMIVQALVKPVSSGSDCWIGVGFIDNGSYALWNGSSKSVWVVVRSSGSYSILENGTAYDLTGGNQPAPPGYVADEYNRVAVKYDPAGTVTVWINDYQTTTYNLTQGARTLTHAGIMMYNSTAHEGDDAEVMFDVTAPPPWSPSCTPTGITTHPSNQTVTQGQTAIFNVEASGTAPLTYQWEYSPDSGSYWYSTGDNSNTLLVTDAQLAWDGFLIRCVVSNSCPSSQTSNSATLTVNESQGSQTVYSDSFNRSDDPDLNGDPLESDGSISWSAMTAEVYANSVRALSTDSQLRADIPIDATSATTITLEVSMQIVNQTGGQADRVGYLGFPNPANGNFGSNGSTLWLEVDDEGDWAVINRFAAVDYVLGSGTFSGWSYGATYSYKLVLHNTSPRKVSMYFNGGPTPLVDQVSLPGGLVLDRVGFQYDRLSGNLGRWQGYIDNFDCTVDR